MLLLIVTDLEYPHEGSDSWTNFQSPVGTMDCSTFVDWIDGQCLFAYGTRPLSHGEHSPLGVMCVRDICIGRQLRSLEDRTGSRTGILLETSNWMMQTRISLRECGLSSWTRMSMPKVPWKHCRRICSISACGYAGNRRCLAIDVRFSHHKIIGSFNLPCAVEWNITERAASITDCATLLSNQVSLSDTECPNVEADNSILRGVHCFPREEHKPIFQHYGRVSKQLRQSN
eukprot:04694_4